MGRDKVYLQRLMQGLIGDIFDGFSNLNTRIRHQNVDTAP